MVVGRRTAPRAAGEVIAVPARRSRRVSGGMDEPQQQQQQQQVRRRSGRGAAADDVEMVSDGEEGGAGAGGGVDLTGGVEEFPDAMMPNSEGMSPVHHALLQALMAQRCMPRTHFEDLMKQCFAAVGVSEEAAEEHMSFDQVIGTMKDALRFVSMSIDSIRFEQDGVIYIGIVNQSADEVSKRGTPFSPAQVQVLKRAIEEVAELGAPLSWSEARRLGTGAGGRNMGGIHQTEAALNALAQEGWLLLQSDPDDREAELRVCPGPRVMLELRPWLETQFKDNPIPQCLGCHNPALSSRLQCMNEDCGQALHEMCAKEFSERQEEFKCPACKQPFGRNQAY